MISICTLRSRRSSSCSTGVSDLFSHDHDRSGEGNAAAGEEGTPFNLLKPLAEQRVQKQEVHVEPQYLKQQVPTKRVRKKEEEMQRSRIDIRIRADEKQQREMIRLEEALHQKGMTMQEDVKLPEKMNQDIWLIDVGRQQDQREERAERQQQHHLKCIHSNLSNGNCKNIQQHNQEGIQKEFRQSVWQERQASLRWPQRKQQQHQHQQQKASEGECSSQLQCLQRPGRCEMPERGKTEALAEKSAQLHRHLQHVKEEQQQQREEEIDLGGEQRQAAEVQQLTRSCSASTEQNNGIQRPENREKQESAKLQPQKGKKNVQEHQVGDAKTALVEQQPLSQLPNTRRRNEESVKQQVRSGQEPLKTEEEKDTQHGEGQTQQQENLQCSEERRRPREKCASLERQEQQTHPQETINHPFAQQLNDEEQNQTKSSPVLQQRQQQTTQQIKDTPHMRVAPEHLDTYGITRLHRLAPLTQKRKTHEQHLEDKTDKKDRAEQHLYVIDKKKSPEKVHEQRNVSSVKTRQRPEGEGRRAAASGEIEDFKSEVEVVLEAGIDRRSSLLANVVSLFSSSASGEVTDLSVINSTAEAEVRMTDNFNASDKESKISAHTTDVQSTSNLSRADPVEELLSCHVPQQSRSAERATEATAAHGQPAAAEFPVESNFEEEERTESRSRETQPLVSGSISAAEARASSKGNHYALGAPCHMDKDVAWDLAEERGGQEEKEALSSDTERQLPPHSQQQLRWKRGELPEEKEPTRRWRQPTQEGKQRSEEELLVAKRQQQQGRVLLTAEQLTPQLQPAPQQQQTGQQRQQPEKRQQHMEHHGHMQQPILQQQQKMQHQQEPTRNQQRMQQHQKMHPQCELQWLPSHQATLPQLEDEGLSSTEIEVQQLWRLQQLNTSQRMPQQTAEKPEIDFNWQIKTEKAAHKQEIDTVVNSKNNRADLLQQDKDVLLPQELLHQRARDALRMETEKYITHQQLQEDEEQHRKPSHIASDMWQQLQHCGRINSFRMGFQEHKQIEGGNTEKNDLCGSSSGNGGGLLEAQWPQEKQLLQQNLLQQLQCEEERADVGGSEEDFSGQRSCREKKQEELLCALLQQERQMQEQVRVTQIEPFMGVQREGKGNGYCAPSQAESIILHKCAATAAEAGKYGNVVEGLCASAEADIERESGRAATAKALSPKTACTPIAESSSSSAVVTLSDAIFQPYTVDAPESTAAGSPTLIVINSNSPKLHYTADASSTAGTAVREAVVTGATITAGNDPATDAAAVAPVAAAGEEKCPAAPIARGRLFLEDAGSAENINRKVKFITLQQEVASENHVRKLFNNINADSSNDCVGRSNSVSHTCKEILFNPESLESTDSRLLSVHTASNPCSSRCSTSVYTPGVRSNSSQVRTCKSSEQSFGRDSNMFSHGVKGPESSKESRSGNTFLLLQKSNTNGCKTGGKCVPQDFDCPSVVQRNLLQEKGSIMVPEEEKYHCTGLRKTGCSDAVEGSSIISGSGTNNSHWTRKNVDPNSNRCRFAWLSGSRSSGEGETQCSSSRSGEENESVCIDSASNDRSASREELVQVDTLSSSNRYTGVSSCCDSTFLEDSYSRSSTDLYSGNIISDVYAKLQKSVSGNSMMRALLDELLVLAGAPDQSSLFCSTLIEAAALQGKQAPIEGGIPGELLKNVAEITRQLARNRFAKAKTESPRGQRAARRLSATRCRNSNTRTTAEATAGLTDQEKQQHEYAARHKALPKVTGVRFQAQRSRFVAEWYEQGRTRMAYFPVKLYGFERARALAIKRRKVRSHKKTHVHLGRDTRLTHTPHEHKHRH